MPLRRQSTANGKCHAKMKAGRPCAAPAVRGGTYCALHAYPERAAQLGRKGGTKSRRVYEPNEWEGSSAQKACDVKNLLAEAMAEIRAGRMDPKLGSTLRYLGASLLKAIETSDLEARLEKLERGLKPKNKAVRSTDNAFRRPTKPILRIPSHQAMPDAQAGLRASPCVADNRRLFTTAVVIRALAAWLVAA
jgi:hypothetical protein